MSERRRFFSGVFLAAAVAGGSSLRAQTSTHPISTKPEGTTPNCSFSGGVTDGKPSGSSTCQPGPTPGTDPNLYVPQNAVQKFPFPGEQPAPAIPSAPVPTEPAAPTSQANPAVPAAAPGQNAVQRFPFPGESPASDTPVAPGGGRPDAPTVPDNSQPPLKDAGSSGSSSSSSSSSGSSSSSATDPGFSSSNAGPDLPDDDPNAPMPTPKSHVNRKKLPKAEKVLSTDEKEAEDVQVAGFYQNAGNFRAAYERAKEAVSLVDDDPDAHLALADAARKLGKLDEAGSNYKKVLALDPVPKIRKVAEKALKDMSGS